MIIIYLSFIINKVNFKFLRQPTVVISNGITPTVFYWLNKEIGNVLNPKTFSAFDDK